MQTIRARSTLSRKGATFVPPEIRRALNIKPGDIFEWRLEDGTLLVIPRNRVALKDIIGLISNGGDAVESKRQSQMKSIK
jgi:AbrB family looped-hinge helix DNA binding protein